jgi:8-oxo-dGTP pyrophosphatase MutT (NUDIX family)
MINGFNFGQMYKVFFNDRVILIDSSFKNSLLDNSLFYQVANRFDVENAWKSFLSDKLDRDLFLLTEQPENGRDFFFSLFKIIIAAGGVVSNNDNRLLCISRWGKWDLPKGKSEKGERPEDTAIREVEEECGISGLLNEGLNSITYHIYEHPSKPGSWILKHTYWYNMNYIGDEKLVPQTQEDIIEARWFKKSELNDVLKNTWASLKPIIESYVNFE